MDERPVARWQKLAALALAATYVAALAVFHSRLGADFWPLDSSRVGPNLVASAVLAPALFVASVLLWPPTRRRLHRLIDSKLAPLHARHDRVEERIAAIAEQHEEHLARIGRSLKDLHEKLDNPKDESS